VSCIRLSILNVLLSILTGNALAQPGAGGPRARPGGSNLPKVGSMLPDVVVFDDEGNEFSTKTLRGQYSLLVFGCLT